MMIRFWLCHIDGAKIRVKNLCAQHFLLIFFSCAVLCATTQAQSGIPVCGVKDDSILVDKEKYLISNEELAFSEAFLSRLHNRSVSEPTFLPIRFMIVSPTDTNYLTKTEVYRLIANANEAFLPAGLQFELCSDSVYYFFTDTFPSTGVNYTWVQNSQIFKQHTVPDVIEVWVFRRFVFQGEAAVSSKSGQPVVLNTIGAKSNSTLSHELGHFFGLRHTHENGGGLVSGVNCASSGDLICDTSADPDIAGVLDADCGYRNTTRRDAAGDLYNPLTDNLMSYGAASCRKHFTPQQLARIAWHAHTSQSYLRGCVSWPHHITKEQPAYSCGLPIQVQFHANSPASTGFAWDLNADGIIDSNSPDPVFNYTKGGTYDVALQLTKNGQTKSVIQKNFVSLGPVKPPYFEDFEQYLARDAYSINGQTTNYTWLDGWQRYPDTAYFAILTGTGWLIISHKNEYSLDHTYTGLHQMAMNGIFKYGNGELDSTLVISPCLDVPVDMNSPIFSFWYHFGTLGTAGLHVDLIHGQDTLLDVIAPFIGQQQQTDSSTYKQAKIDLTPYRGSIVRVRFRLYELEEVMADGANRISVKLDDFLFYDRNTITILNLPKKRVIVKESETEQITDCRKFKDYLLPLQLNQPVGDDTCILKIAVTGNAIERSDFLLPADSIVLMPGDYDSLGVILRVFDDQDAEASSDSLIIRFSSIKIGDVWLEDSTLTVVFEDDDLPIDFDQISHYGTDTLMSQNFDNNPQGWQQLPLGQWTFSVGDYQYWRNQNNFTNLMDPRMGSITDPNNHFAYAYLGSEYYDKDIRYATPIIKTAGYLRARLTGDFHLSPEGGGDYSIDYNSAVFGYSNWKHLAIPSFCKAWTRISMDISPICKVDSAHIAFHHKGYSSKDEFMFDNLLLMADGLPIIDTASYHSTSVYVGPGQTTLCLSDQDSTLICRVENQSAHDFGCVEVRITSSGLGVYSGTKSITTQKSIEIIPEIASTSSGVNVTIPYHQKEVQGWEQQSGYAVIALQGVRSDETIISFPNQPIFIPLINNLPYTEAGHRYFSFETNKLAGAYTIGVPIPSAVNEPLDSQTVEIFPNPSCGIIRLNSTFGMEQISVYNSIGVIVFIENSMGQYATNIDLSKLPGGFYFVAIEGESTFQLRKVSLLKVN
jgi:PKD repeat protein